MLSIVGTLPMYFSNLSKSKKKKSIAIIANFKMPQFHQVEGGYCKIYCTCRLQYNILLQGYGIFERV
jgi:hypothetical protein